MQNFKNGYNCAQAVLLAFSDELEIDEKTLALISSSFGGGMGRMREVCGAVSGMFMVAGLKYGYSDPSAKQEKAELYALIQKLAASFKEKKRKHYLQGTSGRFRHFPHARTAHRRLL